MPRIKSAIKRVEVAERNRRRNRTWKSNIRSARTRVEDACKAGKQDDAQKALNEAYGKIDRAVSKGILHRNTAARRKSRLATMFAKISPADPNKPAKKTTRAKKTA